MPWPDLLLPSLPSLCQSSFHESDLDDVEALLDGLRGKAGAAAALHSPASPAAAAAASAVAAYTSHASVLDLEGRSRKVGAG